MATVRQTTTADPLAGLCAGVATLAPALATRTRTALAERRLPTATVTDLATAGLLRVYNPARFGGYELHMQDVLPLVASIARTCPATAWVLAVYQIHNWVAALMDERAQQEVFADNPDPIICASLNPSKNFARKADGGYLIDQGTFTFCSGARARGWALLGALIKDEAGAVIDAGCLLVPGDALTDLDDWFVSGLQATGSNSLVAKDLFVPAHRFLSYASARALQSPGLRTNPGELFRAAFVPMLVLNLAGPALGAAERALDDFVDNLRERGLKAGAYPLAGVARVDAAATHNAIALARMKIDCARLLLDQAGASIRSAAHANRRLTDTESCKVSLDTSYAVRECLDAVQYLFLQSGGGVLGPQHPLQQAYQDVTAVNVHGFLGHDANLTLYGSLVTGHAQPNAFL